MINKLPLIGLGTYLMKDKKLLKGSIEAALKAGYKHIDTAQAYENEFFIGQILEELKTNREDVFITTKVHPFNYKYHTTTSVLKTLEYLKTNYVDLVLLHMGIEDELNIVAYKELIKLREEGKIKYIGVSNFTIDKIENLKKSVGEYPYCNQINLSPLHRAMELENFCKEKKIILTGYSIMIPYFEPADGEDAFSEEQKVFIKNVAKKYGKDVGQVHNKWAIQNGYHVIPKSKTPSRVATNNKLMDFELTKKEMDVINSWNKIDELSYDKNQHSWDNKITEEKFIKGF